MISLVGKFVIEIQNQEHTRLVFDMPRSEGYIVGRFDNINDYVPDIDFAPYGGRQLGLSRRHAVFTQFRQAVYLVDLGSVNGTFINAIQLNPNTPIALNSGDHIRFGSLIVVISQLIE